MDRRNSETPCGPTPSDAELAGVGDALYAIGGKWRLEILNSICSGNSRFNDIRQSLKGISDKVLSNSLKDLEANDLVKRNVLSVSPLLIEYELTAHSHTLWDTVHSLGRWGCLHRQHIREVTLKGDS